MSTVLAVKIGVKYSYHLQIIVAQLLEVNKHLETNSLKGIS